jgi:hypothetical protein
LPHSGPSSIFVPDVSTACPRCIGVTAPIADTLRVSITRGIGIARAGIAVAICGLKSVTDAHGRLVGERIIYDRIRSVRVTPGRRAPISSTRVSIRGIRIIGISRAEPDAHTKTGSFEPEALGVGGGNCCKRERCSSDPDR